MIDIDVPATTRESMHALAGKLEKEFGHASFGVDLCAILIVRTLRDHPALKAVADYFRKPADKGKLTSPEWADLMARLKVGSNAAAVNGGLRGYGKKAGGLAAKTADEAG